MKHSLFIAFIFLFSFPTIHGQSIDCGFNLIKKELQTSNLKSSSATCLTNTYGPRRACNIKNYEATYNYNSLDYKYLPIVFHAFYRISDSNHVNDFSNITEDIYQEISNVNQNFAGLNHINSPLNTNPPPSNLENSLYNTAIANSIDSKIRFVLPNKNGTCTNGINIYPLNDATYDSLFHSYTSPHNENIQLDVANDFTCLDIAAYSLHRSLFARYAWPRNEYINVFVFYQLETCYGGIFGPFAESNVITLNRGVINHDNGYGISKTLTHELGHYLDLDHSFVNTGLTSSWQFCTVPIAIPDFNTLDVCIDANDCVDQFAPDNALLFGSLVRDLPANVGVGPCLDDDLPDLFDANLHIYGIDYPALTYYENLTVNSNCPTSSTNNSFFYSSDFNFMNYSYACNNQFTPHQILRMHSMLDDFWHTGNADPHFDLDNTNLWSQSNLENIGILKGPDDNTPLEITNAVTYNCPITLIGEVIIKTGGTLTLNDVLMYSDNACLTIEPGGQLIMPNGSQTSNTPYLTWVNNNCSTLPLQFQMRALLEGFYDSALGEMETELQNSNILPLVQPFNANPWYYNGAEAVVGHSTNTSDWVLLRLFDNSGTVVEEQAALINKLGYVTAVNGDPILQFNAAIAGQTYRISIHHKGHLAAIANVTNGGFVDFTRPDVAQGFQQTKDINGIGFLYGGDYDGNGIINNLDYNLWALNSAALNQYLSYDGDGNAIVNNLDYNLWEFNKSKIGEPIIQY